MRLSVVIPSYQRRELVLTAVTSLARQDFALPFEVIVVVDGSTDQTREALESLPTPFPLRVLYQRNRGAAAARSAGGAAARGEILLFMDDDMEADPGLLSAHDRAHRSGAGIVIGHIPLHRESLSGVLSTWVNRWVELRQERLRRPHAEVRVTDLVGGQISVLRAAFDEVGGFDARLTEGGTFGNEDIEFGYRLLQRGHRAVFAPEAVSWQRYSIRPQTFLRQSRESGGASVMFARKHPEMAGAVFQRSVNRTRFRVLDSLRIVAWPVRALALALVERGFEGNFTERLFFTAQALEFCRGLREAGGMPRERTLRVLAYHAIEQRDRDSRFARYEIQPEAFRRHVKTLLRCGGHFVSANEVAHFLRGTGGLPRRPMLITFDDCYTSVLEHALPILREYGVPAIAFAVTACTGGQNEWSSAPAADRLRLLDEDGLRRIAAGGVEIGSHSRTHPRLSQASTHRVQAEIFGSRDDLKHLGFDNVRFFAYPFGEVSDEARRAVAAAGYDAAFTVEPGVVRTGTDRFLLPRVEILRGDDGWRLVWKVVVAGARLRPRRWVRTAVWRSGREWRQPGAPSRADHRLTPPGSMTSTREVASAPPEGSRAAASHSASAPDR